MTEPAGYEHKADPRNPLEGESLELVNGMINDIFKNVGEQFESFRRAGKSGDEVEAFARSNADQIGNYVIGMDGRSRQGESTVLAATMATGFSFGLAPNYVGDALHRRLEDHAEDLGIVDPSRVGRYLHETGVNVSQGQRASDAFGGLQQYGVEQYGFSPVEQAIADASVLAMVIRQDPSDAGAKVWAHVKQKYEQMAVLPQEPTQAE